MEKMFDYRLITLGETAVTLKSVAFLLIFLLVCIVILKIVRKAVYRYPKIEEAKKYSVFSLFKYLFVVFAVIIALQILGFNVSILVAGSAALLVGFGMGIQNLFSDYVSGIVILFDNSVKVGDIVEIGGMYCKVKEISLRTTTVLTRDEKFIILPNTDLTRKHIINWTHSGSPARFDVSVGVSYASDAELVKQLLLAAAQSEPTVSTDPPPFVRLNEFGDSALVFTVYFFTRNVFRVENTKSHIRRKILEDFRKNGISIPFPQRVLHHGAGTGNSVGSETLTLGSLGKS